MWYNYDMKSMKTFRRMLLVAGSALVLGGCSTVEISSPKTLSALDVKGAGGKADRAIVIANDQYCLFQMIPLAAGSMTWIASEKGVDGTPAFFSDELSKMPDAVYRYAESMNCDLVDIVVNNRSVCGIGLFGLMDWFRTIVGCQSVTISGVLRPRE